MKLNKHIGALLLPTFLFVMLGTTSSYAQSDSALLAMADTSRFSVNSGDGWTLYNSYVAEYAADSVALELIIRRENNINWSQEHYVGSIKYEPVIPQNSQTLKYWLLNDQYALRIDESGKCYLRQVTGYSQVTNQVVLPLLFYYRK